MALHDGHRQRKKQRFLQHGLDSFADHEVLELLLFYAIPRRDTNETAHRLLEHFGTLKAVLMASVEELQKVEGVGESAAAFLHLLQAVGYRALRTAGDDTILNSVDSAGAYFQKLLHGERREVLYQVCLDAKGKVLSHKRLSSGTVSMAPVNVREVVENALYTDASGVLLAHNHPSGIALPSEDDRQITLQIRQALGTMGIELVDHIIVADNDFVSMAASGMLL
ncbi:MAG: DNA repair protein RadC [Oscillospiraceae bacterium]|nr:DNA repair protein RadC [Oscillospiraceae bacterium]